MIKIGIDVDNNLKVLLSDVLNYDFIDIRQKDILPGEIDLLVIDINSIDLEEKISTYFNLNISIIILLGKENIREMREFFLKGIVKDCILRQDIFELEESIQTQINITYGHTSFYLSDTYKRALVEFSDVNYITYSSTTRKTEFHLKRNEIFSIKRNFSEVEERLMLTKTFFKLDRGTIINISLIKFLDYKEEQIVFKTGEFIYTSKMKLKELEDKCNLKERAIIF
ncbi:LytTR family transcriptional regulator [Cetobacterium sp. 2A]|uniref:LytTR family transcriptional regulator DNA-binding domain-containing protein n=1 Tax=Cetobacterium sp. 2A TaxID=2754723 RepID=UPI00163D0D6F|nr:LytTR family transcriptional regulator DNA-binding domain-containing protein [Cetobacterium sp. 2A]MBC2856977.1 LytTR family transcriptional regulator [Cetobacterium sp. 2A]